MTQRVVVQFEDDLDGAPADETMTFGLDGRTYEIDLSTRNADKLRRSLGQYVSAGRRISGRTSTRSAPPALGAGEAAKIREWALANGYAVNRRGRIPAEIQQAYQAAA